MRNERASFRLAVLVVAVLCAGWMTQAKSAAPADEATADKAPATASSGGNLAEFDRLTAELRGVSREVRELQVKHLTAAEPAQPALRKQFEEKISTGEEILARMGEVALAILRAGGTKQRPDLQRFLLHTSDLHARKDNYEAAQEIISLLSQDGYSDEQTAQLVGRVAYSLGDADQAEASLKLALKKDAISDPGKEDLARIPLLRQSWPREQALREAEAAADDLPRVLLRTTQGDITLELFENEAPNTVANFISLVEKKFYNGTPFHRVIATLMAQGGDPSGNGTGGPGYSIACECYKDNHRKHFRGSLTMLHSGKDSGGSQFGLMIRPMPVMDGQHTVFGRIIDGMQVLSKLQRVDPDQPTGAQPDKLLEATVLRKRDHEYVPGKL